MKKLFLATFILLVISVIAFGQQTKMPIIINEKPNNQKNEKPPELIGLEGQKAPLFKTVNMNGTEYDLENLRGKIVVVNLWGTFCAPCIEEMPKLNALVEKYKNKNVIFLAPAVDDKTLLEGFLKKYEFNYQVLPSSFGIIEQYAPKTKRKTPDKPGSFVMALPTHLIIDENGTVVKHFWGFGEKTADDLSETIEKLLAEKTTANFKSDAQALGLIKKARIAIGGDANINNVRSLTIAANTENFFEQGGIQETKGGNLEIALELPNRFSKMLRIGNPEDAANGDNNTKVDGKKIIIKKDANGKVLTEDIFGDKTVVVKDNDGKVLTENISGFSKTVADKEVQIAKIREMRQNELLRTTLALLLTAPEGYDVGYFYKGESTIDGFSVNVIEAQTNGSSIKLFLDKSSNLPRMINFIGLNFPQLIKFEKPVGDFPKELIMESGDFGGSVEHQIKFSDYRSVGGLLLPFAWTETVDGRQSQNVNVTNYEINPANIADKFQKPKVIFKKN